VTGNSPILTGTYGSETRYRAGLCALLFAVATITTICVGASLEWLDRPFNGFLLGRNLIVAPIDLPSWSGRAAQIPYWTQLVAIDGEPVDSVDQVLAAAAAAGEGTDLRYTFTDGTRTSERSIPVIRFTIPDWIGLFANYLVNGLALLGIGFFVAFLRPHLKAARALLFFALSWGLSLIIGLADFASFHFHEILAVAEGFLPASLFYMTLCFPTEHPLARRRSVLGIVLASSGVLALLNIVLYNFAPLPWTIAYRGAVVWVGIVLLLSIATAWRQHHAATNPLAREKIKIVLLGILVAFALPFLVIGAAQLIGAELPLNTVAAAWWVFPAALAYAIVKRDLFEIDLFLRRAATYVALSAAIFTLYVTIVVVFSHGFHNLELASSPWFTLLFSLGVLVVVRPLRDWLQAGVDRIFFRTHFDYVEITESLSLALNRTLRSEEVNDYVERIVRDTMAPTIYGLYRPLDGDCFRRAGGEEEVRLDGETRALLAAGRILDGAPLPEATRAALPTAALLLPLCFEDTLEGFLLLGHKNSGATYGPRDLELLRTVANQTAMALRNAASYLRVTELLASLESRVEERTEELQQTQAELRASNEKLRELDRLKTQFFSDASHELRTPLTLVLGPLEEMRQHSAELPPSARRLVELAHSNAATLLVLTDTLLDISRVDAGHMQPACRSEPLRPLIDATAEPFRWLAEQRGIDLLVSVDEAATAFCDRAMMSKIVGNLLANALKFTTEGRIEIRVEHDGENTTLHVADTGPGIPTEELPNIFERYRQASTASGAPFAGSGIGLALVRQLTELQNGSVEVESREGEGTTFRINLPATSPSGEENEHSLTDTALPRASLDALASAQSGDSTTPTPRGRADSEAPTVLVIDDNPKMLDFLCQVLSRDYRLKCAENADRALEALRASPPDLIVSDVMMPGPDGIALCKTLKQDQRLRHIPLILLTARASLESKLSGLEAGADDYITKPFHPEELRARMAALLRMRHMEAELRRSHQQLTDAYQQLTAAQAQLVHAEKMASLGTLVAGVAHEINNPVSFIRSSIDLISASVEELHALLTHHLQSNGEPADHPAIAALRDELERNDRWIMLQENAAICRDGAERAARIVKDLRTFSRPGDGGRELTDLHENLDQSLRLLQGECKGRVTIHRQYGDVPRVPCDPGQISQVFLNLLANSIQAIEGKGEVFVRTSQENGHVSVEIEDDGPGMDAEVEKKIFDPFFTTKEVGKGTGLGLSIVRSLINAHGGDIHVKTEPGRGCVFTVTLPIDGVKNESDRR
jgi:signal transduction histidine kinase